MPPGSNGGALPDKSQRFLSRMRYKAFQHHRSRTYRLHSCCTSSSIVLIDLRRSRFSCQQPVALWLLWLCFCSLCSSHSQATDREQTDCMGLDGVNTTPQPLALQRLSFNATSPSQPIPPLCADQQDLPRLHGCRYPRRDACGLFHFTQSHEHASANCVNVLKSVCLG